jgi:MFS family permease
MARFVTLWTTQSLSLFGTYVTQFGLNIWLTQELYPRPAQKAALALGLSATTLAFLAPMIAFMPIAGAFADRHDRRSILAAADAASFVLTAALVALLAGGHLTLWLAVALLVGYSLCASFHNAAWDSSIPLLAPPDQLARANGMMVSSYALAQLLSPALAAFLIGLPALARAHAWPLPWVRGARSGTVFAFAADALSFAVAGVAILLVRIPRPAHAAGAARTSLAADVREGFRWIVRRRPFVWLTTVGSLANLTLAPLMLLLPLLVRDRCRADAAAHAMSYPAALAAVNVAGGLGAVIGGVFMSVSGLQVRRRPLAMVACIALLALGQVVTGLATTVWLAAAGLFAGELFVAPLNTLSATLWQSLTPPHMLARALSTRRFISQIFFPVGTFLAGWFAVPFEPWVVVSCSGALLALVCGAQLLDPRLRGLEDEMRAAAGRA